MLYTEEVRETLVSANGGIPKFHETAISSAERAHAILFHPSFPNVQKALAAQIQKTSATPMPEHVRRFLKELSGLATADFWMAIRDQLRTWDFDCDETAKGINGEWGLAVALLREQDATTGNGSQVDPKIQGWAKIKLLSSWPPYSHTINTMGMKF